MQYEVLARKYRSKTFDEVVGQAHIAQTLKKAILSNRVAHAYLFCGTRGTGKTSIARIFAKALNCEKASAQSAEPCNECNSCLAVARGEDMDVIEIDAASNTGVDHVRDLIEKASFMPARSRYKIYIIDEVHMLTKNAFNALLKLIEEPPAHVKFILATTEPEKVLPTIQSRCQRFDFRNIPTSEIAGHLRHIAQQEGIQADDDALNLVARAGAGSMRDALSLLDRLLSIGEKKLTVEMLEQLLGMPRSQHILELAEAIATGNAASVLQQADQLIQNGLSSEALVVALIEHFRNLLILRVCGVESRLIETPGTNPRDLHRQAQQFDAVALTQDITILDELRRQIRSAHASRALIDAVLVRLAMADQFIAVNQALAAIDPPSDGIAAKKKQLIEPPIEQPPAAPISAAATHHAEQIDDDDDLPAVGKVWQNDGGPDLSELLKQHTADEATAPASPTSPAGQGGVPPGTDDANIAPLATDDVQKIWSLLLTHLQKKSRATNALSLARLDRIENNVAFIRFSPNGATFAQQWQHNGKRNLIADALTALRNVSTGVTFEVDENPEAPDESAPVARDAISPSFHPPVADEHGHSAQPDVPNPSDPPEHQSAAGPAVTSIPVTPELLDQIRQDPLVAAALDELKGQVLRVTEQ